MGDFYDRIKKNKDFCRLDRITDRIRIDRFCRRTLMDHGASSYRRFLDGDRDAFGDVMKALFHPLVFFIHRYVQDIHTAEDLAMDAFSDLIVHKNRYHFQVSLKTYLFMIGRSRALDYLKRRKIITFTELTPEQSADTEDPETLFLKKEQAAILHRAMGKLPRDMQIAVHLYYFEDMSYQEIARVMKKKPKQVDNLLYRAKKALGALYEKEGAISL